MSWSDIAFLSFAIGVIVGLLLLAMVYNKPIIAAFRTRIAAMEKCIEVRDLLIDHLDEFTHVGGDASFRAAIRRADEEAGRA